MHGRSISVALALSSLVLILGAQQTQTEQTAKQQSSDATHARRSVAVNTLRAINTAEYSYRTAHGGFVPWEILVASKELNGGRRFAVQNEAQLANSQFSKLPEILPGWALRLNVTPDGKGYDVLLEDMTDKTCGYAAITNESGLIRQSKTLDCDI
jgi:hypothetical protein